MRVGLSEALALALVLIVLCGGIGLLIIFDMFGAPHSRRKFWFEFWRSR